MISAGGPIQGIGRTIKSEVRSTGEEKKKGDSSKNVTVRTPLSDIGHIGPSLVNNAGSGDIGPSLVNNAGSGNFNCANKVPPYANVYVRRSKKGKGEVSEACGLGGFCN